MVERGAYTIRLLLAHAKVASSILAWTKVNFLVWLASTYSAMIFLYKFYFFVILTGLFVLVTLELKNVTKRHIRSRKARAMGIEYKNIVLSRFPDIPDSDEVAERLAVLEHISSSDRVLEIGANIGGVSSLLASILDTPSHLLSVDPLRANCEHLKTLGESIDKPFNVFCGVVKGLQDIDCIGPNKIGSYVKCFPRKSGESQKTINLSVKDLERKFSIQFTAVVIDCEGCYEYILPQILSSNSIKQIQIEWDGKFLEQDVLKSGFTLIKNYLHEHLERGVSVYKRV